MLQDDVISMVVSSMLVPQARSSYEVYVPRSPETGVACAGRVAGLRHSDGLRLGTGVALADQHHAHVHANVTPFERLAYL